MNHRVRLPAVREHFPALASSTVFLENAGGSQVPRLVADAIRTYLLETYVQLGAGYGVSRTSTRVVDDAHAFIQTFMNATNGHVFLGASTTVLLRVLADCYAEILEPGREIVIAKTGHEANIGPWLRLERSGVKIRWWNVRPEVFGCTLADLDALLSSRTALVVFPHVSNLLGEIVDVAAITRRVHEAGARVVVDGVAFAPHRAIDVAAWNVDWYAYSTYKVYGPHMAALYGRADAAAELTGPNHFFIPRDDLPYKFELGGCSHEGCAGLLALGDYLRELAAEDGGPRPESAGTSREVVERAFEVMTACELPLQEKLLTSLTGKRGVRVIGPAHAGRSRVATVSFVHDRVAPADIVAETDRADIGIRCGHMYAYRLCQDVGIDVETGVVRVSAVHYNTVEEIDRLIAVLDRVLPA